jgi:hypothetical protein
MITSTANPIDTLQYIMDECCERHAQCVGCPHLKSCRSLWDRASEQTYAKPLTMEMLELYIEEFYRLWHAENPEVDDTFYQAN